MGLIKYLLSEEPGIFEKAAFIIKNVYVPYRGKTSEIDILLIHEKGIYVIESKNYSGWIFGNADQQNWTQMINKNTKERFYNPIKQNKTHIKALAKYLDMQPEQMKSYIVFSERCELKKIPENTEQYTITKRDKLLNLIKADTENNKTVFTAEQIDELYNKLQSLTEVSQEVKEKHIEDINKRFKKGKDN